MLRPEPRTDQRYAVASSLDFEKRGVRVHTCLRDSFFHKRETSDATRTLVDIVSFGATAWAAAISASKVQHGLDRGRILLGSDLWTASVLGLPARELAARIAGSPDLA